MPDQPPTHSRRWLALTAAGVLLLVLALGTSAYVATGGRTPWAPRPASPVELATSARLATVAVRVSVFRSGTRDGAGFVIDRNGVVVTSAHLLRRAASVTVADARGRTAPASLIGIDPATGVAELAAPGLTEGARLALGPEKTPAGTRVLLPGGAGGGPPAKVVTTSVTGVDRDIVVGSDHLTHLLQLGGTASPSNAGGPVLDEQGRVVGVMVEGPASLPFAVPVRPVQAMLSHWRTQLAYQAFMPPLVTADVKTLVVRPEDLPDVFQVQDTTDKSSGSTQGWQVHYQAPATSAHNGQGLGTFVIVAPGESGAKASYQTYLDQQARAGYARSDTAVRLGDEAVLNTMHYPASPGPGTLDRYQVIWRERNVVALTELVAFTGDAGPDDALHLAAKQEARMSADLAAD
jgi:S1-C subfamily serine protease